MSIKIAGIDLVSQALENEHRINILEYILEQVSSSNPDFFKSVDMGKAREKSIELLQKKYPDAGISFVKKDTQHGN